jgi:hypothetical protein
MERLLCEMKKSKKNTNLELKTFTLRTLSTVQLDQVGGGNNPCRTTYPTVYGTGYGTGNG